MSRPLLELSGVGVEIPSHSGAVPIIEDVTLEISAGEVLALVGESGCGKSMTAFAIMRLVPKPLRITESSSILFDGKPLLKFSVPEMRTVRGGAISMIFQDPMSSLNPVRTVGQQVAEVIALHDHRVSSADRRRRAIELFERTGIPEPAARFEAYPHQLSGGLKQRVMIAMALIMRPRLLIADEPTTALDVTVQAQILGLMRELQHEFDTAILLITHDLGVVNELADRVAVMYGGRIVEEAPRRILLTQPRHPYTKGLLASIPHPDRRASDLVEIPGVVPTPGEGPMGCRFATRCPMVFAPCHDQRPLATDLGGGQRAWCHAVASEVGPS
jgi:peptide/nickel transport system ATP-binding protein